MTSELGPSARALLDAARGDGPDAGAIARMRAKIGAAVAPSQVAGTATVTSSLATKLGLVAFALVVATGAVILATRDRGTAITLASPELAPRPSPTRTAREVAPPVLEDLATIDVASIEIEKPTTQRRAAAAAPVAPRPAIELAREVELVDRAMTALRRGEPRAALAAVRLHATETAHRGQLAEDATAIEIEALCTLHDPSARSRLAAFDTRWPASAQRTRLTTACK